MPGAEAAEGLDAFDAELHEGARTVFLVACPLFTAVVVAWTGFDWLLAPQWWEVFLGYRLVNAAIGAVLFVVSWQRWTERHRFVLLAWVLSVAGAIAPMLPVVSWDVFPYYVMGFSLTLVGMTTFATLRPRDALVSLSLYVLLYLPNFVLREPGELVVVGSSFFLATLVLAVGVQALHRYQMALEGWRGRVALAAARDEALEADRAKSSFLARMSHELRTPLNAIIGYAELVSEELNGHDEALVDLGRIDGAGRHLLELINDVLDLSKISAGELEVRLEPVQVGACIEEVRPLAERLAAERGNCLEWAADPVPVVQADPLRLRQVVLNLISNAAKFTDHGTVRVRVSSGAGVVFVDVDDDGIGMDADQVERAFLPFVQVHSDHATFGGTGLGLAVSRQLAGRMGGSLTAQSALGEGSCFRLTLQVVPG